MELLDKVLEWITNVGIKAVIALLVMWIAFGIINRVCKKLEKVLFQLSS